MDDLSLLLNTMREAGAIALSFHGRSPKVWSKKDGTVVTEADIAVDDFLKSTIKKARPDDGWLSEETKDTPERLAKSRLWIADPIDGTRAFSEAKQFWGCGMALTENGQPVMGAIYCPVEDVMFHAVKGGGAFSNGVRLPVADTDGPVIIPRKAQAALDQAGIASQIGSPLPLLLRFAGVADGRHAGAISLGNKSDWDLAAGHLMVTETGGTVTNQHGQPLVYNRPEPWQAGLVAAQQNWHDRLIKLVGTL
jgi:myo-inositol-1(or 4)-monophosphatase